MEGLARRPFYSAGPNHHHEGRGRAMKDKGLPDTLTRGYHNKILIPNWPQS